MAKDDHTGRKLAVGGLVAGLAGYLAGVLTAPKSGKQTRGDITDKAEGVVKSAETELVSLQTELKDAVTRTKSEATALSGKAREEFNEALLRAKDAQTKATSVLKAVKAGQANDPELNKAVKQAKLALKNLGRYLKS